MAVWLALALRASSRTAIALEARRFPRFVTIDKPVYEYYNFKKMRWIIIFAALAAARADETCLSAANPPVEPYLHFGLKTAYNFADTSYITNFKPQDVPGCKPTAIWLVNRHGSHNPEKEEISSLRALGDLRDNIMANYHAGNLRNTKESICRGDVTELSNWQWKKGHNETFAGRITSNGYIQTEQLARSWRSRYPGLLTDNHYDYVFKFMNDLRSKDTFRAFTDGLFNGQTEGLVVKKEHDKNLLEPHKTCNSWLKNVDQNNETLGQKLIFESKREFAEMVTNISLRLGFNYDIEREIVHRMYQICRYNKAWEIQNISPWCAAFSREDLKRLEYAEDLETYYKYGYGSERSEKLGCTLVKDFIDFFQKHVEVDVPVQPKASIQFVEAPMLLMLLTALGARRDPFPLTGDNYHINGVQSRQWLSSVMSPYNGNLAAVLYKCNPNGNFQVKDRHQVLFLHNEREMKIENCKIGLCEWPHVLDKFGEIAKKCDLGFCSSATRFSGFVAFSLSLVAFVTKYILL